MKFCTSFLLKPSSAIILACSGQITIIASGPEGPPIFWAKLINTPSDLVLSRSEARTEASALIAVTVLWSDLKPRSTWSGAHGLASSFSPMHIEYLPGQPRVALQVVPGYEPPILRCIRRTQRPMVALARHPSPNAFEPPLMLSRLRIGPLTIIITAGPPVVACKAYRFNLGSVSASTAAIKSVIYSGLHPASTALIAIFSTVAGAHLGGTTPITS